MSCCPGIKWRNTGSGYVKEKCASETASELSKRMTDLLAARDAQDRALWEKPATKVSLGEKPVAPKSTNFLQNK
jgi:hypothetical protein